MKRTSLLICLVVWLLSLTVAYYIGSEVQSQSVAETENADTPEAAITRTAPRTAEAPAEAASESIAESPRSALEDYLDGEPVAMDAALATVSVFSAEKSRLLLADALALPTSEPNRPRLIEELLAQLAKTEPMAALETASEIASLRDREDARIAVLEVWGRNDPAAAIAWAERALEGEPSRARSSQLSAIFEGYAATNPQAAFAQAMALDENPRIKNRLLGDVIEAQIQAGSLEVAKTSVDSVTDPELRENLRDDLIDEWAAFDPVAAGAYIESLGEGATPRLKTALVSEWAESDPVAAAAWLSKLEPEDPAVARGSAAIIREWTRYDLAASADWLNSLPDSPELDRAVASYAFRAAEEDPEAAMTWAGSIKDDRRRSWMMERVAGTWKEQDSESFESYLNNSDFTEEQRSRMENARSGGRGWGRWR